MKPGLRDALLDALAVLLPTACAACGAPDRAVCDVCAAQLRSDLTLHTLVHDGRRLPVWCALDYSGVVTQLITALKEKNRTDVAGALAMPLAAALGAACELGASTASPPPRHRVASLELLTVPSSRASVQARGYDPVPLLLARVAGVPRPAAALRMTRQPRDQAGLGAAERWSNLHGSLRARGDLTGRRFLLVDDVLTTGATLWEAHRAVVAAGGEVVCAATLAHTARRHPAVRSHDGSSRTPP